MVFHIFKTNIWILICLIIKLEGKLLLKIDRFDYKTTKDSPVQIDDARLNHTEKLGTFISFVGHLNQDISGKALNLKVAVSRCSSRESLDTCEPFRELHPSNFCMFFEMKGAAWNEIVESFNPPFKCPFKKGKYELINKLVFDPNKLAFTGSLVGPSWKATSKFYNGKQFLFEVYNEFKVVKVL